jgi:glycosyltransferase involved in cell wall biosynthesis
VTPVVIIVPVLRRPHRVAPVVESIEAATPQPHRVLFVADPDDHAEIRAIRATGADMLLQAGSYAAKINAGAVATDEPLIFCGADDLHFHPGWLPAATAALTGPIEVVGTNDLGNQRVISGEHATHNLVARRYLQRGTIDQRGLLLHPGYHHNFVDDELVQTARMRGAWAFARESVVEHLHPDWGKGTRDATYARGRRTFRFDRRLYQRRRVLWT